MQNFLSKFIYGEYWNLLTKDSLALLSTCEYIVDKERIIQYYNVNNLLCGRNIDELRGVLKSIQYINKNSGQACSVN